MASGRGKFHHIDGDIYDGMLVNIAEYFIQVTGKMIRPTDMEFTTMLTDLNTKVNGKMISNMARAMSHGLMAASSMVFTLSQRKRGVVCIHGLMATSTLETGLTISFLETESIPGVTGGSMLDSGRIMSCTERALTNGLMVECTTEITRMTRRMVLVFMSGLMDAHISATGFRESKIMRESTFCQTGLLGRVSMRAITEKNG